jgi:hypothetical protein
VLFQSSESAPVKHDEAVKKATQKIGRLETRGKSKKKGRRVIPLCPYQFMTQPVATVCYK